MEATSLGMQALGNQVTLGSIWGASGCSFLPNPQRFQVGIDADHMSHWKQAKRKLRGFRPGNHTADIKIRNRNLSNIENL